MAGHSKWAQIKRQKGVNDAKRGVLFSKLGKQLQIAARWGREPEHNPALAMAIEKAKAANMPMSNIERAVQRASDKAEAKLEEVMYEGYGPGGVAVLVDCATDNRNRTYPEIRLAFSKNGGHLAEPGSVAFQFSRKGMIRVKGTGEDLLLKVLDAGAEDAIEEEGEVVLYVKPTDFNKVREALLKENIEIVDAEISYVPNNTMEISNAETARKALKLMDALEDLEDVTNTYTNFDIPEGVNL